MSILPFIRAFALLRLCLLADGLAALPASSSLNANPQALAEALHARSAPHSVLLIDGDNVRGKTGFQLSKEQLVSGVLRALDGRPGLTPGRVVLFFDHGSCQDSFLVRGGSSYSSLSAPVCITFAGGSADDVIADDVRWWGQRQQQLHREELQQQPPQDYGGEKEGTDGASVFVVTDDSGLKGRCRRAQRHGLHFISSLTLATYLRGLESTKGSDDNSDKVQEEDQAAADDTSAAAAAAAACDAYEAWAWATTTTTNDEHQHPSLAVEDGQAAPVEASSLEALVASVKQEQWVRGEIRRARRQLKHGCSRKKRTKLQKMLTQLEAKAIALAASSPTVVGVPAVAGSGATEKGEGAAAGVPPTRLLHHIVAGSDGHHASAAESSSSSSSSSSSAAAAVAAASAVAERDALLRGLLAAGAAARRGGPAKMGSGGGAHAEHTWERVVHAERLRLRLVQLAALPHHAAVTTAAVDGADIGGEEAGGTSSGHGARHGAAARRWLREYAAARSAPAASVVVGR